MHVRGLENYRAAGSRVVIVAEPPIVFRRPLIAAFLPDSPSFAIHTAQAKKWWVKPFLNAVDTFPVDVQSPYAVKRMVEAVRDHDRKLMIFPEGRLTRTGALMKVYEGAGLGRRQGARPHSADLASTAGGFPISARWRAAFTGAGFPR